MDAKREWTADPAAVLTLKNLGFDEQSCIQALFVSGGNVDFAAAYLLENAHDMASPPTAISAVVKTFKMVLVVNESLGMGVGKVAAQVAHACLGTYRQAFESDKYSLALRRWEEIGETKIVLRAPNALALEALAGTAQASQLPHFLVRDAGRTQVAAGSVTALGVFGDVEAVNNVTGNLQLL